MSVVSAIAGSVRGLLIAAATGVAALGLLAVFNPLDTAPPPAPTLTLLPTGNAGADLLRNRIEAARLSLRDTEAATAVMPLPEQPTLPETTEARTRYDTQLAAVTERRDLALRHAAGIREALERGGDVASLAGIRDSVVAGQLLARQSALEADIAEAATRLRPGHPTMLALAAQKTVLAQQIRTEAANLATALEAEADLDSTQLAALQSNLATLVPTTSPAPLPLPNAAPLREKATSQRAELDGLMQAYLNLDPAASVTLATSAPAAARPDPLAPLNLLVVAIAALAALVFQIALARTRRRRTLAADVARWREDRDPDLAPIERVAGVAAAPMKAAS
jgi:uncharacterized protein involved in exopolysaccharide biosynthesis